MKIAFSSDLHLTTRAERPERFVALVEILDQLVREGIKHLVIAGDLFDQTRNDPGEFEQILANPKYSEIQVMIIPGNHDPDISQNMFAQKNIKVYSEPEILRITTDLRLVFIPYSTRKTYGEILSQINVTDEPTPWVLIGHGDYLTNLSGNDYEKGAYMPICRKDIEKYNPRRIFLGHIHQSGTFEKIGYYPGSPSPIDSNETGYRSYLVFDSKNYTVSQRLLTSGLLFFTANLLVIPAEDEESYVIKALSKIISGWEIPDYDKSRVRVNVKAYGFSSRRADLSSIVKTFFTQQGYFLDKEPDMSEVKVANDQTRLQIAKSAIDKIMLLDLPESEIEPNKEDIILASLKLIYKRSQ